MDDAQVAELRRWAAGLASDTRPELKAAAKAIELLSDDLLATRSQLLEERLIRQALESREDQPAGAEEEVTPHLLDRIRGLLRPKLS